MSRFPDPTTRLTDAILDLDYGDEQERTRYYEAYAVIVHLQLIGLPIVGAVVVFALGASAIAPALAMLVAAFGCVLFGMVHLQRHHVPLEPIAFSARNRLYLGLYALAWMLLVLALVTAGSDGSSFGRGAAIGAVIGAPIGLVALVVGVRRQRELIDDAAVDDVDGPNS